VKARPAPNSNQDGWITGYRQFAALAKNDREQRDWGIRYDPGEDVLVLRKEGYPGGVGYHVPNEPRIVFYLDPDTSELTGLDFAAFQTNLVKRDPSLVALYPSRRARLAGRFRWVRRHVPMPPARRLNRSAAERMERTFRLSDIGI